MTIKGHILRTASEIAMGRYMRAPDHPTAQDADDAFAAAFEDLAKDDGKPAAGVVGDKGGEDGAGGDPGAGADGGDGAGGDSGAGPADGDEGAAAGAAGDEGAAGDLPVGDDAAAAAADGKGGKGKGAKAKAPADAAPASGTDDADDVLKRLADLVKDQPPADTTDQPAAEEKPLYTAEEEAKLDHFRKEWPEVAEAFELQAKGLAHSVLKYAFSQIGEQFVPLKEMVESLAVRTHYGDLTEKVGTYTDKEREEIIAWVGEQPTYLQTGMMSVIEAGTAEEVADLVGRYREATGKQPAGAQVADTGAPGGDPELSSEAKQAAAALAPVSSKRSAVQAPDDKSDFDGAFAKFADMI